MNWKRLCHDGSISRSGGRPPLWPIKQLANSMLQEIAAQDWHMNEGSWFNRKDAEVERVRSCTGESRRPELEGRDSVVP